MDEIQYRAVTKFKNEEPLSDEEARAMRELLIENALCGQSEFLAALQELSPPARLAMVELLGHGASDQFPSVIAQTLQQLASEDDDHKVRQAAMRALLG